MERVGGGPGGAAKPELVRPGGGPGGGANPASGLGGGVGSPFPKPAALRALRIARWCWFMALFSCSLVSMSVSMVSLSGEGFSAIM